MHARFTTAFAALCCGSCALTYDPALAVEHAQHAYGGFPEERAETDADESLPEAADLQAALRFALRHNAELRAAFARWRAALERVPQVSALPEPMLSYTQFLDDLQAGTASMRNRFGIEQSFPWPSELPRRGEAERARAEAAWHAVEVQRFVVTRDLKRAWLEYAFLGQAIRIDEDSLALLRALEPVTQRKVQSGGGQQDLLRLQVEIGTLENDLESLRKLRPALLARLDAVLNRPGASRDLQFPALPEPLAVGLDAGELWQRAEARSPELRRRRQEVTVAEADVAVADVAGLPVFRVGVDGVVPWEEPQGDDPFNVMVQMSLPLWRSKYAAARREAVRLREASGHQLVERGNALRAEVAFAAYELDDAARQVALLRDTLLPRARQSFEVVQAAYRTGAATLLEVIDAQRQLLGFEKSARRAVKSHEQSVADLEALCGGEVR